ncbi:MAG: hypothetical protein JWP35_4452 [Caulobacter sp.]|nr:hypothetical protein [Caulobacter sp.]
MALADRKPKRARRWWGLGLAAALHVAMIGGLMLGIRVVDAPPGPQIIEVELAPAWRPRPPARTAFVQAASRPSEIQIRPAPPPADAPSPPPSVLSPAPPPMAPPASGFDPGLALRGSVGCGNADFLQLSAAERQGCERRMARAGPGRALPLALDPAKRAAFTADQGREPFLTRRPKKGCRVRAQMSEVAPPGGAEQHDVTVGVACVIPF